MLHKDTFEVCTHNMTNTSMFNEACKHFEPKVITNGDKIRQMSNEELICMFEETCGKFSSREEFLAWLNAPAESEGEAE